MKYTYVDLYIRSPIRLHGIVLHYLRTGTPLLFITEIDLEEVVLEDVDWIVQAKDRAR
jgi:hypothetical protein